MSASTPWANLRKCTPSKPRTKLGHLDTFGPARSLKLRPALAVLFPPDFSTSRQDPGVRSAMHPHAWQKMRNGASLAKFVPDAEQRCVSDCVAVCSGPCARRWHGPQAVKVNRSCKYTPAESPRTLTDGLCELSIGLVAAANTDAMKAL